MWIRAHSMLLLTFGSLLDAIPIDNGVEGNPEVECGPFTIAISFNTRNTFQGHVFVKGRFEEPGCRIRSLNPKGIFVSTTLVVAFHPQFLTKVDRAYKVQCFYMETDKTVSTAISVTDLTTVFASHNVPMPICRYEILESGPDGSQVTYAMIGMQVYHKWSCDSETRDTFCMRVHSCIADDGKGKTVSILDEKGCAIDKYVLNNLDYPTDLMAGQEAHVYKFADRSHLFFQCQISISIKEPGIDCSRPSCESLQRTRRAVDSLGTLDVLSQTIETLDVVVLPNNLSLSYSFRMSSLCIEPLGITQREREMRYGKIYFYDRMGNRVNDSRREAIRGFDSFDVPNFRPPSDDSLTKTYGMGQKYDSLSPPIKAAGDLSLEAVPEVTTTHPPFQTPPPEIHQRRTSLVTPPPVRGVYPIESPPPTDNIPHSDLLFGHLAPFDDRDLNGADVARHNEAFPEHPAPHFYTKETEEVPSLSKYDDPTIGLNASANGIYSTEGLGGCREHVDEDLCERCKYEQRQMDAMRAEIEKRRRATASVKEGTQRYVDDFAAKETNLYVDEESRKKALEAHIDSVNQELINRRITCREPEFKEVSILRSPNEPPATRRDDELRYKEDLDRQVLSRQRRTRNRREQDLEDSNCLNLATAKALAEARELRLAQEKHEQEQLRKFHDLQVQLKTQKRNVVDEPWWMQRPDEHGWREWRLRARNNQLERNTRQQDSLLRLADFKRRLEQQDEHARNEQKLKYDAIREKIHEQSSLINEPIEHRKGIARPANEAVIEAWKREWRRNDERYRVLQDVKGRKSYLETIGMERVRRCRRCLRPIGTV